MNTLSKLCCRFVGILAICCSAFALWYNVQAVTSALKREANPPNAEYFHLCVYLLTTLAALIAVGIGGGGIELIRLRKKGATLTAFFGIAPLIILSVLGALWLVPHFGKSIAMASGVSMGGLMPVLITLLPLWALLVRAFTFKFNSPALVPKA